MASPCSGGEAVPGAERVHGRTLPGTIAWRRCASRQGTVPPSSPGDDAMRSTRAPLGNAKAAVIISDDGGNWTPWTTFTSGAYRGRY